MSWRNVFKSQGMEISENMDIILPKQEKVSIITEITEGEELKNNPEILKVFESSLLLKNQRQAGFIPKHYTKTVECQQCGIVKLWQGCLDFVLGCPWCLVIDKKNFSCK